MKWYLLVSWKLGFQGGTQNFAEFTDAQRRWISPSHDLTDDNKRGKPVRGEVPLKLGREDGKQKLLGSASHWGIAGTKRKLLVKSAYRLSLQSFLELSTLIASNVFIGFGKKARDPAWENSICDSTKSSTWAAKFSARISSGFRLEKEPFSLALIELKSLVHKSTHLRDRSLTCFHEVNRGSDLWSLRRNHIRAAISLSDGNPGLKISKGVRTDAENALFDYLYRTRCLSFSDAEHISKNSPVFVKNLIAKVKQGDEVGQAVSKFLLFNPINEFEPFLESLGLNPSELYPLLPHDRLFLSEDDGLIENYHTLCRYGVPRSKIGKMYKEGKEIFKYDSGVLNSKLKCYENLGLSKLTIIKLVTCSPSLLIGDLNEDFVRVLKKLKALGVDLDLIRGCFSDKNVYKWGRILKMLHFLDGMYSNKKHMASLINEHPRFVFHDSGKKIYILVALFLKLGLKIVDVVDLFVKHPQILAGRFVKRLWCSIIFLFDIGMGIKDIRKIVKTHAYVLGSSYCQSPVFVMQKLNLSKYRLRLTIRKDPNQFPHLVSMKNSVSLVLPTVNDTFLRDKIEFLLRLGFVENSDEFYRALKEFRGRGDLLQNRFDFLVNIGLDYHTVVEMIKSTPALVNQSVDAIDKKINYLLNELGYPLEVLAAYPSSLCFSLKRIKLRFSMFHWLKENGIKFSIKNRNTIKPTIAFNTILKCSDAYFFKLFVDRHPDGPEEWDRLKRSIS
ncbi:hypothetical protein HPP92_015240 [Vanilla planifolia]|uniref:Uncharacterized protein n=1 Tax=Vanilla planifolia TaxID=51239 RepID=A0A835UTV4_VANPL|nr:hypothetical protein HPP92_015240 [Vanilla planifolia]